MLSRQAQSLYWLGRYQERAEYLARLVEVKYFSTMDASLMEYRQFALKSILFMSTGNAQASGEVDETYALRELTINKASNTSISHYLKAVRENTLSVRNLVSSELWEAINKNYHFANGFDENYLLTMGLYEFTRGVQDKSAAFHAKLESTMLHDNVWAYIKLGIFIERGYQLTRILQNTASDIESLKQGKSGKENRALENYQWHDALKVLEATDMTQKLFRSSLHQHNACEFLTTNLEFPRSMAYTFSQVNKLIKKVTNLAEYQNLDRNCIEFKAAKLAARIKYMNYGEIKADLDTFLNNMMDEIVILNDQIHAEFFDTKTK